MISTCAEERCPSLTRIVMRDPHVDLRSPHLDPIVFLARFRCEPSVGEFFMHLPVEEVHLLQ